MTGSVGYGRQSHGKQKSIDEQLGCYIARVSEEGWENRDLFTDKISASPYAAKKVRGGWPKLLKRLTDPDVNVLWLWESSRGDRKLSGWSRMLEICGEYDVKIFVESHDRLYDVSVGRDWKTLADEGTDSEYASRKSSVQIKRAVEAQIRDGRPPGRTPYGCRRIYGLDEQGKRKFIRQEAHPAEAPAVREIFRRLHADDPANGIATDLNEHGPALRTGKPWTLNRVVSIAKTAAYTGLRVHSSDRDMAARRSLGPGVEISELVNVERLVTREVFYAVQAKLADPARKTTRPGGAKHLLSYVAKCGTCDGPLTAHGGAIRKPTYYCPAAGHVTVPKGVLDDIVIVEAVSYLIETGTGRQQEEETPAELQAIRDELAELRHRKEAIGPALATGDLSVQTAVTAEKAIDLKIAGLEKRDRQLSVPAKLHDLLDDPDWLVAERWVKMSVPARKETMRLLLSEEHLGELYVMPAPPQGRGRGAQTYPLWRRLEWRKAAADGQLLGRRRVSKTEWSPWYVVGADTARAAESAVMHVASGDQARAAESGTVVLEQ